MAQATAPLLNSTQLVRFLTEALRLFRLSLDRSTPIFILHTIADVGAA